MDINNNGTNNISNNGVNNLPPQNNPNTNNVTNNTQPEQNAFTVEEFKPESIVNVTPVVATTPTENEVEPQNINVQTQAAPTVEQTPVQSTVVEPYVPDTQPQNIVPNTVPVVEAQNAQTIETVTPTENTENNMTVVDTEKKKTSSIGIIILLIILVLFVVFIDPISEMIETNFISKDPVSVNNSTGNNLVNGYIMIDDNNGFIKLEEIKFYNFKKTGNNNILLNYESSEKYDDVSTLNIYIELYTSEKQLLYKSLFVPTESISKDTIRTYNINVDADVYEKAYYALVKIYTEQEKNKTSVVNCKYLETTENYNIIYDINYNFVNEGLTSYSVDKKIEVINLTNDVRLYMDELKKENEDLNYYSIENDFNEYQLMYIIDLNQTNNEYIPLYKKNTTPYIIKNKEKIKKWICE